MSGPAPYYSGAGVTLYLGRCEDILPHLSGIQLTVTSPPYNQLHGTLKMGAPTGRRWRGSIASHVYSDDLPEAEYQQQQITIANKLASASTPSAAMFYNHKVRYRAKVPHHPLDLVRQFDSWQVRQEIVWNTGGSPAVGGGMFVPGDERIYWLVRDLANFTANRKVATWTTVWDMPRAKVGRVAHPVPFPITIPERAVLAASRPNDLVCDPYAGSGTTLRAAKLLHRRAVGIESEERFVQAAAEMLEAM
jgi:hypothetical protein